MVQPGHLQRSHKAEMSGTSRDSLIHCPTPSKDQPFFSLPHKLKHRGKEPCLCQHSMPEARMDTQHESKPDSKAASRSLTAELRNHRGFPVIQPWGHSELRKKKVNLKKSFCPNEFVGILYQRDALCIFRATWVEMLHAPCLGRDRGWLHADCLNVFLIAWEYECCSEYRF